MDYQRIYDGLIGRARLRQLIGVRTERHHIIPKCLEGGDESDNLVDLTPEEHYVAHQLLVKIHPGNTKLIWAALAMTGTGNGVGNGRSGNKLYGWLRRQFINRQIGRKHSEETKRKIGAKSRERNQGAAHPSFGLKRSPETCARISAALVGKYKGRPKSAETRARMKASWESRRSPLSQLAA